MWDPFSYCCCPYQTKYSISAWNGGGIHVYHMTKPHPNTSLGRITHLYYKLPLQPYNVRDWVLQSTSFQTTVSSHQNHSKAASPQIGSLTGSCTNELIFLHPEDLKGALPPSHESTFLGSWMNKDQKIFSTLDLHLVLDTISVLSPSPSSKLRSTRRLKSLCARCLRRTCNLEVDLYLWANFVSSVFN